MREEKLYLMDIARCIEKNEVWGGIIEQDLPKLKLKIEQILQDLE